MSDKVYQIQADILLALSHSNRIKILEYLRAGEKCNCEIYPALGLEQSNLSRHLKVLQQAGLVITRKQGLSVYYQISDPNVFQVLDAVKNLLKTRLQESSSLLAKI